jgi:hypothetical protein
VAGAAVAFSDLVDSYAEVTAAVLVVAGRVPAQGRANGVDGLRSTLVVQPPSTTSTSWRRWTARARIQSRWARPAGCRRVSSAGRCPRAGTT